MALRCCVRGARLDYYSAARWAESAPAMLQSLVIETLSASQRFALVESDLGPFPAEYVLSLQLREFEATYTGARTPTVHVTLACSFGRRGEGGVIRVFLAQGESEAGADRMQSVVTAFQAATDAAMRQMAMALSLPLPAKTP